MTMTLPTVYGEYGNHQMAFSYLSPESQAEIVTYCHGVALMMNEARGAAPAPQVGDTGHDGTEIVAIMPSGPITRAELDAELARTESERADMRLDHTYVIGINASSNMFA